MFMKQINTLKVLSIIADNISNDEISIDGIQIGDLRKEFYSHSIECDLSGSTFESIAYEHPYSIKVSKTEVTIRKNNKFLLYDNEINVVKNEELREIENIIKKIIKK